DARVVFGVTAGDPSTQISAAQAAGKVVVLLRQPGRRGAGESPRERAFGGRARAAADDRFIDAAAVAIVDLDELKADERAALNEPTVATQAGERRRRGGAEAAVDSVALLKQQLAELQPAATLRITREAAAKLFSLPSFTNLKAGTMGGTVNASLDFVDLPSPYGRNVVGIIPGSDPV